MNTNKYKKNTLRHHDKRFIFGETNSNQYAKGVIFSGIKK